MSETRFKKLGVEHLAVKRGGEGSACRKEEGEGELVWRATIETHSSIQGETAVRLVLSRVGLNKLVVEEGRRFGSKVEQVLGVSDVGDL